MIWRVLYDIQGKTYACEYTSAQESEYQASDIKRYALVENLRVEGPFFTNRPAVQGPIELNPKPPKLRWEVHENGFHVLRISPGNGAVVYSASPLGGDWRAALIQNEARTEQGGFKSLLEAKEFVQLSFGYDPRPTLWDRLDKDPV